MAPHSAQLLATWTKRAALAAIVGGVVMTVACGEGPRPSASGQLGTGSFAPVEGPCVDEGATRECHVNLGKDGEALRCFVGKQECVGGLWTACGGSEVTLSSVDVTSIEPGGVKGGGGLKVLANAVGDSGVCLLDPCDPYCNGFNEDAGVNPEGGAPTLYYNGTSIFGGAPGGFAKKSDCGSSGSGCAATAPGAPYPRKCNGEDHFSFWDSCLADTHCDTSLNGGQGECVANWNTNTTSDPRWDEANGHWLPAVCAGADITVSAACEQNGVPGFNVCNRGNTTVTAATIGIYLDNGNANFGSSTFASGSCPNVAPTCSPTVPGGSLAPGKCFRVTNANCAAWDGSGNPVAYVNPNRAVTECGGALTASSATGPGCNNNWADVKNKGDACSVSGASFVATSKSFGYDAVCTPGFVPRWKALTYSAVVPCSPGACNGTNAGKVEFFGTLSTKNYYDGATSGTPETIISAATTTKTVNCTFGTDAGGQPVCPVNLLTWAESVVYGGSNYAHLDLRIKLTPTPDTLAAPYVASWSVSYDCIPYE